MGWNADVWRQMTGLRCHPTGVDEMVLAHNYSHPCHYNGAGTGTQDISVDDEFSPSDTLLVSIFIMT